MTAPLVYLDHAATTPLAPEVRAAMEPFFGPEFGNPSSRHALGVRAAEALDAARRAVARALGARPADVVLTSGGTEANDLGVLGAARARRKDGRHVVVGPTEHPCVREAARALASEGFEVETAALDGTGALDLADIERRLRPDTVLVAQMLVSNEVGTVYPVREVARLARRLAPRAAVHVDAVQALGKVEVDLDALGCDSVAVSAHKVHGPKGSGALVLAEGTRDPAPLLHGGGQERGLRSGTENVAGAVGLGRAVELADRGLDATRAALAAARAALVEALARVPEARLLEPGDEVVPSIAAVRLPGPPAEVWLHHLEARGVLTSVGSACQARAGEVPAALRALGLDEAEARRVLRVSFSRTTTVDEVRRAGDALAAVAAELEAFA